MIIGRKKEIEQLHDALEFEYSEFVAVNGRRRVGKTCNSCHHQRT